MAYESFAELTAHARAEGSIAGAALAREALESAEAPAVLRQRMAERLEVMREAMRRGLSGEARSRSGIVGGDAARMAASNDGPVGGVFTRAIAIALAVSESNAAMGRVVAAPTGGASGVLPGVLLALSEERGLSDDALVDALFTAAALGAVISARTSLSGAAAGCQAEVGAAAAMAAGAATDAARRIARSIGTRCVARAARVARSGVPIRWAASSRSHASHATRRQRALRCPPARWRWQGSSSRYRSTRSPMHSRVLGARCRRRCVDRTGRTGRNTRCREADAVELAAHSRASRLDNASWEYLRRAPFSEKCAKLQAGGTACRLSHGGRRA